MFGGLFSSSEKKFSDDLLRLLIYLRTVEADGRNTSTDMIPLVNLTWKELNTKILEEVSLPLSIAFIYMWLLKHYGERGDTVFGHLAKELRDARQDDSLQVVPMVLEAHNSAMAYAGQNVDDSTLGNPPWVIARGFCDSMYGTEKGANASLILSASFAIARAASVSAASTSPIAAQTPP